MAAAREDDIIELYSPQEEDTPWLGVYYTYGRSSCEFHARLPLEKVLDHERVPGGKPIKDVFYQNKVVVRSKTFDHTCRQLSTVSPHVKLFVDRRHFEFHVENPHDGTCGKQSLARWAENEHRYFLEQKIAKREAELDAAVGIGVKKRRKDPATDVLLPGGSSADAAGAGPGGAVQAHVHDSEYDFTSEWADLRQMKDTVEQRFPLKFLCLFSVVSNAFPTAELFFSKNQSLIVRYKLQKLTTANGSGSADASSVDLNLEYNPSKNIFIRKKTDLGYLSYFIKPMLQADGQRDQDVAPAAR